NNGVLSDLDGYIKSALWQQLDSVVTTDTVSFGYDFHLLSRWLLKLSYNSARITDRQNAFRLYAEDIIEYILGTSSELPRLLVCAHIIKNTPPPFHTSEQLPKLDSNYKHGVRISNISFNRPVGDLIPSRMVSINNYSFYLFYGETEYVRTNLPNEYYRILSPTENRTILPSGKYDFWTDSLLTAIRNKPKRDQLVRTYKITPEHPS
ncbi:MAG: hypothetical protein JRN15_18745, partial [Nitrososphaerota archaeon]|nr:hypothetical protein [Nitrososphaerota archaeon]